MRAPKSQDVILKISTIDSAVRFGTEKYVLLQIVAPQADGQPVLYTLKLGTEQWKKAVAATTPSQVDGVLSRAPRPKIEKTGPKDQGGGLSVTGTSAGLGILSIEPVKKSV